MTRDLEELINLALSTPRTLGQLKAWILSWKEEIVKAGSDVKDFEDRVLKRRRSF